MFLSIILLGLLKTTFSDELRNNFIQSIHANTFEPSGMPSTMPSGVPSAMPSKPTVSPTGMPSGRPSGIPSSMPSGPTGMPSSMPSGPTGMPSGVPSASPSGKPVTSPVMPTDYPSGSPTLSDKPTIMPTKPLMPINKFLCDLSAVSSNDPALISCNSDAVCSGDIPLTSFVSSCSATGEVTGLSLSSLMFITNSGVNSGSLIPTSIGQLTQLETFSMVLTSPGPGGNVPNFFSQLKNLKSIVFSDDLLTGSIPTFLGSFSALTAIDLKNNLLTGSVPDALCNGILESIDVSGNSRLTCYAGCLSSVKSFTKNSKLPVCTSSPTPSPIITAVPTIQPLCLE